MNLSGKKAEQPIPSQIILSLILIYNKPFSLTALKIDSVTDELLSDAHFALYRSVAGIDGAVKDLDPMPGYADLVTDQNGVIPKIDKTLAPGKYYLTEISPPPGHEVIEEDIVFTVYSNGIISIDSEEQRGYLTIQETDEYNYILRVPNAPGQPAVELTITKTVTGAFGDRTKEFTFTLNVEDASTEDEFRLLSERGI